MNNLILGDCLEVLKTLPDNSVDSVVTDPPYGLSFMGKRWDYDVPSEDIWRECLRVLKPGGHLLAFAGTRTQHRMAVRIEDAGFEIRDMIAWVYGSGFPKSLNIGKAVDKSDKGSAKLDFVRWMQTTGIRAKDIDDRLKSKRLISQTSNFAVHFFNEGQPALPTKEYWEVIQAICDERKIAPPNEIEEYIDLRVYGSKQFRQREVVGTRAVPKGHSFAGETYGNDSSNVEYNDTAPATEAAKQWEGWGTALKPALEPITVARKPLGEKTVAENVLTHGTGGINIDGCRVESSQEDKEILDAKSSKNPTGVKSAFGGGIASPAHQLGRFPANLIHDGSEEVVGLFPHTKSGKLKSDQYIKPSGNNESMFAGDGAFEHKGYEADQGSAARFFYCAKASKKDRDNEGVVKNIHATVKPTDLMRYLCRLVTPPGGTVLDPFMGSGSTGKAAALENFRFIGIEKEREYYAIAKKRIEAVHE